MHLARTVAIVVVVRTDVVAEVVATTIAHRRPLVVQAEVEVEVVAEATMLLLLVRTPATVVVVAAAAAVAAAGPMTTVAEQLWAVDTTPGVR